ncbi:hypothetical protein BCV69DRAFT_73625 [Microstroma glucosiphilum]|uniref:Uncharacterized protein n=1 Tax=Pseudomicrostroma glucosiphilum TaxID=1684307 RepID=A0A316U1S5_9BASI|nr:hypothetical protein BCV69DRAFT_73625 [Pseudomicrostroma glucosiphilum]PWN18441.1 hypothetical protein BCV69DRAFT_73625 [Pseudomicrostroma glucosiphilum]
MCVLRIQRRMWRQGERRGVSRGVRRRNRWSADQASMLVGQRMKRGENEGGRRSRRRDGTTVFAALVTSPSSTSVASPSRPASY